LDCQHRQTLATVSILEKVFTANRRVYLLFIVTAERPAFVIRGRFALEQVMGSRAACQSFSRHKSTSKITKKVQTSNKTVTLGEHNCGRQGRFFWQFLPKSRFFDKCS
jgi:hypothetical protein